MIFADRIDAGRRLADRLQHLRTEPVVVLGLPRGGVPVAFQVAEALGAPLDVIVVRKLGVPYQPELAMGAIGEDGVRVVNDDIVERAGISERDLERAEAKERAELERRVLRFRGGAERIGLKGRTAVIVDDGIATGSTALAACEIARAQGAKRIVLAVPVAPYGWKQRFAHCTDEMIALAAPEDFSAVGQFYLNFRQVSDEEVMDWLNKAAGLSPRHSAPNGPADTFDHDIAIDSDIEVLAGPARLTGRLTIPPGAIGVVVFAHGSGSSSHSPRNRYVASVLNDAGLGTLLFDLLTRDEEHDRAMVFDVELLAERLVAATEWLRAQPSAAGLSIGYFGASTGAAAALWAAAEPGTNISAVVSRGGRPDLASPRLAQVNSPTLLIVGGDDKAVLELNHQAKALLRCESRIVVIPGATHLFEEPGTLQAAAEAARDWFVTHLDGAQSSRNVIKLYEASASKPKALEDPSAAQEIHERVAAKVGTNNK